MRGDLMWDRSTGFFRIPERPCYQAPPETRNRIRISCPRRCPRRAGDSAFRSVNTIGVLNLPDLPPPRHDLQSPEVPSEQHLESVSPLLEAIERTRSVLGPIPLPHHPKHPGPQTNCWAEGCGNRTLMGSGCNIVLQGGRFAQDSKLFFIPPCKVQLHGGHAASKLRDVSSRPDR